MPTRDRVDFVLGAVELWYAQDYPERELIIVDDGLDRRLESLLPADPRISRVCVPRDQSIGMKRNRGCALASGEYIAHWDDDDWYAPGRLSAQLEPLLAGRADITGLRAATFLEIPSWRAWKVTPALHRRLFREDVHGGTLVYRREVWERLASYPDASLAEDAGFLLGATQRGARLTAIDGANLFVYIRHYGSTWRFKCGEHVDRAGWVPASAAELPSGARRFCVSCMDQAARHRPAPARGSRWSAQRPALKVTAIMPTRDRGGFVARAIRYFARQDYVDRELVILDDGDDPVSDVADRRQRIRYVRLEARLSIGAKRNLGCELARGDVVVHWDDDDWYAPNRISYQVEQLKQHGASVCGPRRLLYYEPMRGRAWLYEYPADEQDPWVAGSALCYRIEAWLRAPFPDVDRGEDTSFVRNHILDAPLVLEDHRFVVALLHGANTSSRIGAEPHWRPRPVGEIRRILGSDYETYGLTGLGQELR